MNNNQPKIGGYFWYLVIAKRGRERLAKENLERQGFEVYLPMHAPAMRTLSDKPGQAPAPRPFLPGYLFVAVDLDAPGWRKIYSTFGVHSIYTSGSGNAARPRALPNSWIEQLQMREVNGLIVMPGTDGVKSKFERGAAVTYHGRSADIEAVFIEPVDVKRVAIIVSLLGRDSRQVVSVDAVAKRST
ncbi:MAG: hypothetical protein DCF29_03830 [Alphaproteobacteria bacterium]|nr:MAG: hypothetical protein DCF29_03830 [Alphaproteobacteria bacterium]